MSAVGPRPAALAFARRAMAGAVAVVLAAALPACFGDRAAEHREIRVPADAPTIQDAVDMAGPFDTIRVADGTYAGDITVPPGKDRLTIHGEARNAVVIDGRDRTSAGITVHSDHVTVENLTLHSFRGNALLFQRVDGFAARYVTVWNVGGYGLYAIGSHGGVVEHSLVSGAANAAFYIGECQQCETTISDVTALLSGLGYSGTNAGGGLVIRDSLFDRNGTGILPNSFNDEANPPQRGATFLGNSVTGSGSVPTPAGDPVDGLIGIGIGVAGGQNDVVRANTVTGSARYGIALFATIQPQGSPWRPHGTVVRANRVSGSGLADLAVGAGAGGGNCFEGNRFATSLPDVLERLAPCSGPRPGPVGVTSVSHELEISTPEAFIESGSHPPYTSMPEPPPQPEMPGS